MSTRAPKTPAHSTPAPTAVPPAPPTALEERDLLRLQVAHLRVQTDETTLKEIVRQHAETMDVRKGHVAGLEALSAELRERYDLSDAKVDVETGAITRG